MKLYHTIFIIALVYIPGIIRGQYWVAGDTTGYYRHVLGQDYSPETSLEFDMDCDGVKDFDLVSTEGGTDTHGYAELDIILGDSVLNLYQGNMIDTINIGDTIWYQDTSLLWGYALVCQNSPFGYQGQCDINNKYIVFRKIDNGDSTYLFMRITAYLLDFTIHEIISVCPVALLGTKAKLQARNVEIVPNPFRHVFSIIGNNIEYVKIYNIMGKQVAEYRDNFSNIAPDIPPGLYSVQVSFRYGDRTVKKIIKH